MKRIMTCAAALAVCLLTSTALGQDTTDPSLSFDSLGIVGVILGIVFLFVYAQWGGFKLLGFGG